MVEERGGEVVEEVEEERGGEVARPPSVADMTATSSRPGRVGEGGGGAGVGEEGRGGEMVESWVSSHSHSFFSASFLLSSRSLLLLSTPFLLFLLFPLSERGGGGSDLGV